MKGAAKVFIIIGMIAGFWMVLPLVFGIIVLKKINTNQLTTGWKVITLLFVSMIGGILLLCSKDEPVQVAYQQPMYQQPMYQQPVQPDYQQYQQPVQPDYQQYQQPDQSAYSQNQPPYNG